MNQTKVNNYSLVSLKKYVIIKNKKVMKKKEIKISIMEDGIIVNSMIISLEDLQKMELNHNVGANEFVLQLLSEIEVDK